MAIKLVFTTNREVFRLDIENKVIWYSDRRWEKAIRLIPKDDNFIKKIILSRNTIPSALKDMFELSKIEQEEYDNAKDDNELADICIKDVKKKGGILIKKENEL